MAAMSSSNTLRKNWLLIELMLFADFDDALALRAYLNLSTDERGSAADEELAGPPFNLAAITDERCRVEFRFHKTDMPRL